MFPKLTLLPITGVGVASIRKEAVASIRKEVVLSIGEDMTTSGSRVEEGVTTTLVVRSLAHMPKSRLGGKRTPSMTCTTPLEAEMSGSTIVALEFVEIGELARRVMFVPSSGTDK